MEKMMQETPVKCSGKRESGGRREYSVEGKEKRREEAARRKKKRRGIRREKETKKASITYSAVVLSRNTVKHSL